MAWPASFSGWLLEAEGRPSVQMNDYPRQNPAYRLTRFLSFCAKTHKNPAILSNYFKSIF